MQIGWKVGDEIWTYDEAYAYAKKHGMWNNLPPMMLRAMENRRVDGDWISPSSATGCPRSRVLQRLEDYVLDPNDSIVPTTGKAVHLLLAGHDDDEVASETTLSTHLWVLLRDGTSVPYLLQGTDDHYDGTTECITDIKTTRTASAWKQLPYERHVLQINLYSFLRQTNGYPVSKLLLWYIRQGGKEPRYEGFEVAMWSMQELDLMISTIAEPLAWYQKTGELPQNRYDPNDFNCMYCPVVNHCLQYRAEGK